MSTVFESNKMFATIYQPRHVVDLTQNPTLPPQARGVIDLTEEDEEVIFISLTQLPTPHLITPSPPRPQSPSPLTLPTVVEVVVTPVTRGKQAYLGTEQEWRLYPNGKPTDVEEEEEEVVTGKRERSPEPAGFNETSLDYWENDGIEVPLCHWCENGHEYDTVFVCRVCDEVYCGICASTVGCHDCRNKMTPEELNSYENEN